MSKLKAIIFDKDGTLTHFNQSWRMVWNSLESEWFSDCASEREIADMRRALGITADGFKADSVYVQGTAAEINEIISNHTNMSTSEVQAAYEQVMTKLIKNKELSICLKGEVVTILRKLAEDYSLFLVTADSDLGTEYFLNSLQIGHLLTAVYFDCEQYKNKPHADIIELIESEFKIDRSQMLMVGDTDKDLAFAINNNLGHNCLVKSDQLTRAMAQACDYVIDSVDQLPSVAEKIELSK